MFGIPVAHASTVINLGSLSDFASSTFSVMSPVLTDLSPWWITVSGVILAVVVITILIKAIHH